MSKCSVTAGSDGTFIIRLPKRNVESFEEKKKLAVNFSFPNVGNLCMYVCVLLDHSLAGRGVVSGPTRTNWRKVL